MTTVALVNRAPGNDLKIDYTDAARSAAKTESLQLAAKKALIAIGKVNYQADGEANAKSLAGRPRLAPPALRNDAKTPDSASRFVGLMATIVGLIGDASIIGLENRLASMRALAQSLSDGHQALAKEIEAALAELEKALGSAATTEKALEAAKARVSAAQSTLDAAQASLDSLNPEAPEYLDALAARDAAKANLQTAQQGLGVAVTAHTKAVDLAAAANLKLEALSKRAEKEGVAPTDSKESQKKQISAAAQMVLIMAKFAELMGDAADTRLEADKQLATAVRDSQAAKAQAEALDHEKQVAKAEAAAKTAGCIGKILGGVMMLASVVMTVVSLGTASPIAAMIGVIGLGLMVGDMVGKALTGVSFMEKAMQPLMDKVLSPLIKVMADALSSALESLGVSADKAQMIGSIGAAIAAALLLVAVMVVVAVVGKGAAARLGPQMGKMIGSIASKIVPDLLKQSSQAAFKASSQFVGKMARTAGLKNDAVSMAKYATRVDAGVVVTETVGVATQSSFQVKSGVHQARAAEKMAAVVMATSIVEAMSNFIAEAVQMFGQSLNKQSHLMEQLGVEMQNSMASNLSIARNI
jgi:invasin B